MLRLHVILGFGAAVIAAIGTTSSPAISVSPNVVLPLQEDSYVPGELIVRFKPQHRSATLKAAVINRLGATTANEVDGTGFTRVVLASGDSVKYAMARYQNDATIELVQPNFRYFPQRLPNDPFFNQLWALKNDGQLVPQGTYPNNPGSPGNDMGLDAAWDLTTDCSSTVVAVIDTGINYTHLDLVDNMWDGSARGYANHGYDFVDNDADPMPADGDGHGTHVAGAIAATGDNARGTTGVCWRARLMALRALNAGGGTTDTVVRAVRFATENGARIINLSLGGSGYDRAFEAEIEHARQQGAVVVVAGGNGGRDTDASGNAFYPCNFTPDNIVCVAALDQAYSLASFSNFGSRSVDVAAPGTNTHSTWPGLSIVDGFFSGWTYQGGWQATDCNFGLGLMRVLGNPANWCSGGPYSASVDDVVYTTYNLNGLTGAGVTVSLLIETVNDGDSFAAAYAIGGDPFVSGSTLYERTDSTGAIPAQLAFDLQNCLSVDCKLGFRFRSNSAGNARGVGLFQLVLHRAELNSDRYQTADGTSMAAPHVSGIAALVWSYNPNFTYVDVVNAIKYGGDVLPQLQPYTSTGRAVDALGALHYINTPVGITATVR